MAKFVKPLPWPFKISLFVTTNAYPWLNKSCGVTNSLHINLNNSTSHQSKGSWVICSSFKTPKPQHLLLHLLIPLESV